MELGKKMAIFDWEWGQNLAPREIGALLKFKFSKKITSSS